MNGAGAGGAGRLHDSPDRKHAEAVLSAALEEDLPRFEEVAAVDADRGERRWYVRLQGEERDFITIWFHLGERMLHYECQFMPAPMENAERLWEWLLRLNQRLVGVHFSIGPEDAVYLVGAVPIQTVTEDEVDRVTGTIYAVVEQYFRAGMRIGYASRFRG